MSKSAYLKLKAKYRKNTCTNYFRRVDQFIMRPIFIYHYNEGRTKKHDEFMDLFFKDADKLEEIYLNEDKGNTFIKNSFDNVIETMQKRPYGRTTKDKTNSQKHHETRPTEPLVPRFGGH